MAETAVIDVRRLEPEPIVPLMLRVEEAAELCGLGRTKFLELLYAGEVPGVARFGRSVRIHRGHLEAWLDKRSS